MTDSTRRVASKQPVVLDPNFFSPPGVVDVRYVNDSETGGLYPDDIPIEGDVVIVDDSGTLGDLPVEVTSDTTLMPPASISVVSQTVRVTADGKFVVDVVIDVDDSSGVTTYETRLTKV